MPRSSAPFSRRGGSAAVDGNAYFNRPGRRLVEALEMLAAAFHPEAFRLLDAGMKRIAGPVITENLSVNRTHTSWQP